ncbi:hypothetical protein YB2330_001311 [Saitoella coloradoensis]
MSVLNKVINGESYIRQHTSPSTEHISLQSPRPAHIPAQIPFEGPERPKNVQGVSAGEGFEGENTSFEFCEGGWLTPPAPVLTLSHKATQIAKPGADLLFLENEIRQHRDVLDTPQLDDVLRQRGLLGAATSREVGLSGFANRTEQDIATDLTARCEQVPRHLAQEKREPSVGPPQLLTSPTAASSPVLPPFAIDILTVNGHSMTRNLLQESASVSTPGLVMSLSSSPQGSPGSPLRTPPIPCGKETQAARIQFAAPPELDTPRVPVAKRVGRPKKATNAAAPVPTECTLHGKTYTTLPAEHQPKSGRPGEEWFCPFHNIRKAPRACENNWRTFTGIRKHFDQHHQGCPIPVPTKNVGPVVERFSGTTVEKRFDFGVPAHARKGRAILISTEANKKREAKGEEVLNFSEPKRGGKRLRFDAHFGRPNPLVRLAKRGQQPAIPLYIPMPLAASAPQLYVPVPAPTLQYPIPAQVPYNMQVPRTMPIMPTMAPGSRGFSFDDMPMPTQFRAAVPRNYGAQYTHTLAQAPLSTPGLPHWARESMDYAADIFAKRDPIGVQTQTDARDFVDQMVDHYARWEMDIDQPKSGKVDHKEFNFANYFGVADESACEQQNMGKNPEEVAELDTEWAEMCASAGLDFGMTA